MKKTIIIVAIVLVAVILGVSVALKLQTNKRQNTEEVVVKNENVTGNTNKLNNSDNQNRIEEITNYEENKIAEEPKTDLEKAMYIVTKDWGKDDSVYFDLDGTTETGDYLIAVRDTATTKALAWYTVNPKTGDFVKE